MAKVAIRTELSVPASPEYVREAREFAAGAAGCHGLSSRAVDDVRLCVSEAVTNAVRHAYDDGGAVLIVIEPRDAGLRISVRDFGSGMRPSPAGRRPYEGGLGLTIIERLSESLHIATTGLGTAIDMTFGTRPTTEAGTSAAPG